MADGKQTLGTLLNKTNNPINIMYKKEEIRVSPKGRIPKMVKEEIFEMPKGLVFIPN